MNALLSTVFWVSMIAVVYSYVGYPWLLRFLVDRRPTRRLRPPPAEPPPTVSVLCAAHNEAAVIGLKLDSLLASDYPAARLEILVGDDASTDATADIVRRYVRWHPQIRLLSFPDRGGKPAVLNELVRRAKGDILVLTDANILFERETISRIVPWFRSSDVGVVAANVVCGTTSGRDDVSTEESAYVRREIRIKRCQSELSGVVIAPFGACFAVRRRDYRPVPPGHAVDDFFISLLPQARGLKAIQSLSATCREDLTSNLSGEFRRKVRISRGNFQNLALFRRVAVRFWTPLGFHLVSHKVLRWIAPELLLVGFVSCAFLAVHSPFHLGFLALMCAVLASPLVDLVFRRLGCRVRPIRLAAYFLSMNAALAVGFVQWLSGRTGGIWQPTQRA
jgi:cellulose synthase/poly-beta-1,6-N-acetylglucosamine synthase-like glycosyltransferase